jgi:hypothetical protein
MLLVLIPIVWVALLALLAAVCRVAADGDAARAPRADRGSIGTRLTLSSLPRTRPVQSRDSHRRQPRLSRTTRLRRPTHRVG